MSHRAKVTFTYPLPGGGMGWVTQGQELPDSAAVISGREALFDRVPEGGRVSGPVAVELAVGETATPVRRGRSRKA